jgi:DNA modification methylase
MFSFVGDCVLDPFVGTGSTIIAAIRCGRNSIGNEVDPRYFQLAAKRVQQEVAQASLFGAAPRLIVEGA